MQVDIIKVMLAKGTDRVKTCLWIGNVVNQGYASLRHLFFFTGSLLLAISGSNADQLSFHQGIAKKWSQAIVAFSQLSSAIVSLLIKVDYKTLSP